MFSSRVKSDQKSSFPIAVVSDPLPASSAPLSTFRSGNASALSSATSKPLTSAWGSATSNSCHAQRTVDWRAVVFGYRDKQPLTILYPHRTCKVRQVWRQFSFGTIMTLWTSTSFKFSACATFLEKRAVAFTTCRFAHTWMTNEFFTNEWFLDRSTSMPNWGLFFDGSGWSWVSRLSYGGS